ncbi:hypothetical protein [Alkalimarinus coralli]|uniref:hypothetical protein n=1 Tax=Alkalimarinus coralli TaxID=2935863 RepID=UPI00202B3DC2|nr:hypothetical protein [Alkalimarinus coralli]
MNTEVYADWKEFSEPMLVGTLRSSVTKNKEHFSFSYDQAWLTSPFAQKIDPDLNLFSGEQHSADSNNFRVFLDSCPDRWGRFRSRLLGQRTPATLLASVLSSDLFRC